MEQFSENVCNFFTKIITDLHSPGFLQYPLSLWHPSAQIAENQKINVGKNSYLFLKFF